MFVNCNEVIRADGDRADGLALVANGWCAMV